jgi:uncharacterized protein (DUF2225 family)
MSDKEIPAKQAKLTFFSNKTPIVCPVCGSAVPKEEILSGSGRLVAADLTDELHRLYENTQKFGHIYPLVYSVLVCPKCYFAALPVDFTLTMRSELKGQLNRLGAENLNKVQAMLPNLNFNAPRTLNEGIASYLLALLTYEKLPIDYTPAFKQALVTLRAAWLCSDFHDVQANENYDYLSLILRRKAAFYYRKTVELEEEGTQSFTKLGFLGPDQDQNYGFEGVLYLSCLRDYKSGNKENIEVRIKLLEAHRSTISRIVGMGKSNRNKTTAILEHARKLYDDMKIELNHLTKED